MILFQHHSYVYIGAVSASELKLLKVRSLICSPSEGDRHLNSFVIDSPLKVGFGV